VPPFDLPGVVRRIRRAADLSQRELARQLGLSKSTVAAVETGQRGLEAAQLAAAAQLAGLRLALLDRDGHEVAGMAGEAVRDAAGRRYPAHLDTRYGDQAWWHGDERYSRRQPWYTYDRVREWRDERRERLGTPDDHQLPQPGDSPQDRRAARQREARLRRGAAREELRRRLTEGRTGPLTDAWTCTCPPGCDATREVLRDVHVEDCPSRCDVA
jgi:HTH-type transcriptional regulator/antitoxin HipB